MFPKQFYLSGVREGTKIASRVSENLFSSVVDVFQKAIFVFYS